MDNMVKTFVNEEFGSVRTIEENGRVMFCGKDVALALGYRRPKDAITAHCKGAVKRRLLTNGGAQEMKMISEGDVYRLISHSRLPSAEKFESWIFDEILPQINHTGGYVSNEDMFIENYLPFLEEPYQKLFRLQMTAIRKLNERIRHDQPLVDFANHVSNTDNLIDMNAMAKLAADEHFKIGRTRLFRWLKYMGVLMANNLPYQQFIDRGYFAVKESIFEVNGLKKTYQQTLVTGKGQRFVINLLKKYYGKEVLQ
ncbi:MULTISPECIES: phage antirepressor KilAC domain-containing protein [Ruminococcus]|uniref:phage antirepressor KilAC domain-containing protein n=1 Tax=Ruminococcus TaxID=1263 RepID=UPI003AF037D3